MACRALKRRKKPGSKRLSAVPRMTTCGNAGRRSGVPGAAWPGTPHLALGAQFSGQHLRHEIAGRGAHYFAERRGLAEGRAQAARFRDPRSILRSHRGRVSTFFGDGLVAHVSFADPICPEIRRGGAACGGRRQVKLGGTYLCMEGPAFSTKAESNVYRSWGMDVIGMTNLQEAKLAREAEICYVTVAMVTDYDCWHPDHDAVTVNDIIANLMKNAENACTVVAEAVAACPGARVQMRFGAGPRHSHRPHAVPEPPGRNWGFY